MKYLLLAIVCSLCAFFCNICIAWDGFDADSAELIEVIPDQVPNTGDKIEVRNYETDSAYQGFVEGVTRNRRTIELVVRDGDGKIKTLVMEGR